MNHLFFYLKTFYVKQKGKEIFPTVMFLKYACWTRMVICFADLTNIMAQSEGDFEKGEHFGSIDTLNLLSYLLKRIL